MGCSSSSMAYPGDRVQAQSPYQPAAHEFNKEGQAISHFISYGGGNALVLQEGGPQVGAILVSDTKPSSEYAQVTIPPGVEPGQTINVQVQSGRLNEIVVPPGMGQGSYFTVEFAEAEEYKYNNTSATSHASNKPDSTLGYDCPSAAPIATTTAIPADDGFVSGFNNPNFVAASTTNDHFPRSDARPVYNSPPSYAATSY